MTLLARMERNGDHEDDHTGPYEPTAFASDHGFCLSRIFRKEDQWVGMRSLIEHEPVAQLDVELPGRRLQGLFFAAAPTHQRVRAVIAFVSEASVAKRGRAQRAAVE